MRRRRKEEDEEDEEGGNLKASKHVQSNSENFLNLGKEMVIHVQEAFRTPNRQDQKEFLHIILQLNY
jgi:hypothetical protein